MRYEKQVFFKPFETFIFFFEFLNILGRNKIKWSTFLTTFFYNKNSMLTWSQVTASPFQEEIINYNEENQDFILSCISLWYILLFFKAWVLIFFSFFQFHTTRSSIGFDFVQKYTPNINCILQFCVTRYPALEITRKIEKGLKTLRSFYSQFI